MDTGKPSEHLESVISQATNVVVLTGAGISAESGMPTFRDPHRGLWAKYRPEELATPEAFRRDPELVWGWYRWRRELATAALPNAAHLALAEWESTGIEFHLVTQNVDGLHHRAGSRSLLELHGNIHRERCTREGTTLVRHLDPGEELPRCPDCGAPTRPDVVWFGESLDPGLLQHAFSAAERCELLVSVGTSSLVYPAAALPGHARQHGALFVEFNTQVTPLTSEADFVVRGPAAELLPRILG